MVGTSDGVRPLEVERARAETTLAFGEKMVAMELKPHSGVESVSPLERDDSLKQWCI